MRTAILLIRHGQSSANAARRWQGQSEVALTAFGRAQSSAIEHHIRRLPLTVVVTSPALAARQTAEILCAQRTTCAITIDARWHERAYGGWEGLTRHEVEAAFPGAASAVFAAGLDGRPPGGETLREVAARVLLAWEALTTQYHGERIAVVTHSLPIQLLLCHSTGQQAQNYWHWRVDAGSLTACDHYAAGTILRSVNWTPKLKAVRENGR